MAALYVSDLDGTLLRRNETISEYTRDVINRLIRKGMLFSYATAIIPSNEDDGVARWLESRFRSDFSG